MYYQECVLKQYRALREQGLNVDVISMEHVLDGYKILAVPMAYLFCDGYEEKLRDYVKQGGTLVLRTENPCEYICMFSVNSDGLMDLALHGFLPNHTMHLSLYS